MAEGIVYDALVVGGGPAGLTAALQVARFNRRPILFDVGDGRSSFHQINHNYLGFPGGLASRDLCTLGRQQVRAYPVAFVEQRVTSLEAADALFAATVEEGATYLGRTVVLATGVRDHFPIFPDWRDYVGRTAFWCITCDGYSTRGKRIVIVGNDTDAGVTALQFLDFTPHVTVLTNDRRCGLGRKVLDALERRGVPVDVAEIARVDGHDGILGQIVLSDGRTLALDFLFSLQGQTPNSDLARALEVAVDDVGYILTNQDQQTNVPGVFAAGDVTRMLSHQIATAVHEGNTAAQAVNYYLYAPEQRHETYADDTPVPFAEPDTS